MTRKIIGKATTIESEPLGINKFTYFIPGTCRSKAFA